MKIAPEYTEKEILRLMHKQGPEVLQQFLDTCRTMAARWKKTIHFIPYFIASHPGCTSRDMERLAEALTRFGLQVRQFQDFTPTPGTLSTAMYVPGCDPGPRLTISERQTSKGAHEPATAVRKNPAATLRCHCCSVFFFS